MLPYLLKFCQVIASSMYQLLTADFCIVNLLLWVFFNQLFNVFWNYYVRCCAVIILTWYCIFHDLSSNHRSQYFLKILHCYRVMYGIIHCISLAILSRFPSRGWHELTILCWCAVKNQSINQSINHKLPGTRKNEKWSLCKLWWLLQENTIFKLRLIPY